MSNPAVEPVRSINWPASLVFAITGFIALVVAPWYGLTHGYSLATVLCATFLVAANAGTLGKG